MGPTPFYGARAEKTQKADFAMKQTNICRLSGDIKSTSLHLVVVQPDRGANSLHSSSVDLTPVGLSS